MHIYKCKYEIIFIYFLIYFNINIFGLNILQKDIINISKKVYLNSKDNLKYFNIYNNIIKNKNFNKKPNFNFSNSLNKFETLIKKNENLEFNKKEIENLLYHFNGTLEDLAKAFTMYLNGPKNN
jgi:hypothetical protein